MVIHVLQHFGEVVLVGFVVFVFLIALIAACQLDEDQAHIILHRTRRAGGRVQIFAEHTLKQIPENIRPLRMKQQIMVVIVALVQRIGKKPRHRSTGGKPLGEACLEIILPHQAVEQDVVFAGGQHPVHHIPVQNGHIAGVHLNRLAVDLLHAGAGVHIVHFNVVVAVQRHHAKTGLLVKGQIASLQHAGRNFWGDHTMQIGGRLFFRGRKKQDLIAVVRTRHNSRFALIPEIFEIDQRILRVLPVVQFFFTEGKEHFPECLTRQHGRYLPKGLILSVSVLNFASIVRRKV